MTITEQLDLLYATYEPHWNKVDFVSASSYYSSKSYKVMKYITSSVHPTAVFKKKKVVQLCCFFLSLSSKTNPEKDPYHRRRRWCFTLSRGAA